MIVELHPKYGLKWCIVFQNITITFQSTFQIETDVACAYDYVKIYTDGGREMHGKANYEISGNYKKLHTRVIQ